jgi:hypothetical protein
MPAKAGIQNVSLLLLQDAEVTIHSYSNHWIPAFAGMTRLMLEMCQFYPSKCIPLFHYIANKNKNGKKNLLYQVKPQLLVEETLQRLYPMHYGA